jgi:DNA-binding NtrC family response regulator
VLAEDEDDLREALSDAIRDAGCEVIAVADVPSLERVLEQTRADVLLADFQLFDQTTEPVVTRVVSNRMVPEIAIVSAAPAARACAEKLAVRHISKPFDLDALLALVASPQAANG